MFLSPKRSKSRQRISLLLLPMCTSRGFSPLFLFRSSHVYLYPPRWNNSSGGSAHTHTHIRDCWLVTVIPSSHFWCKWGEIKGYHLSANALRTISFPALCTTSIFKAGFPSIRFHECSRYLGMKHDFPCNSAFWNYNTRIFFYSWDNNSDLFFISVLLSGLGSISVKVTPYIYCTWSQPLKSSLLHYNVGNSLGQICVLMFLYAVKR